MLFEDALVCAGGYVNAQALKNLIEHANFERDPATLSILRICHLELWLRDLERRSQTAKITAPLNASASSVGNGRRTRVAHLDRVSTGSGSDLV